MIVLATDLMHNRKNIASYLGLPVLCIESEYENLGRSGQLYDVYNDDVSMERIQDSIVPCTFHHVCIVDSY